MRNAEASYTSADGDAITMASGQMDPARVVRGQPVRDVSSRAGKRNYSGLFLVRHHAGSPPLRAPA